jgi:hypothetical protein
MEFRRCISSSRLGLELYYSISVITPYLLCFSFAVIKEWLSYPILKETLCNDNDDVYLDKLQTRGVKKSILYLRNVDYIQ